VVKVPKGESLDDVRVRATSLVDRITAKHESTVALVSHPAVGRGLACALLGLDNPHFWNIKQDVAGITIFNYAGGRFIWTRHNDTSHLKELQKPVLDDF
jgi:broad specificity phosphatase PhoE